MQKHVPRSRRWGWLDDATVHRFFEIGLVFKGLFAFVEIAAGFAAVFVSQAAVLNLLFAVTEDRLDANPGDPFGLYLLRIASNLSVSTQHFIGFYLVAHGLIKAVLVAGLWREKLSFFPAGISIFLLFIAYQLYHFVLSGSLWLLAVSIIDAIVIWFIWREYGILKKHQVVAVEPVLIRSAVPAAHPSASVQSDAGMPN